MAILLNIPLKYFDDETLRDLRRNYPEATVWVSLESPIRGLAAREALFWNIIDMLDLDKSDEAEQTERVVQALRDLPAAEIIGFQGMIYFHLALLQNRHHDIKVRWIEQDRFLGEMRFLHACCGVIAKGREHFRQVIESLTWGLSGSEFMFPPLLTLASEAYLLKTGQDDLRYWVAGAAGR